MSRRRVTIHDLLAEARRLIARLTPADAYRAQSEGAVLVDTRSEDQRREQGVIPGALHCPLSVLEWHLDPDSGHSAPGISLDSWVILVCSEGYSSSLAAARLLALGFARATDVIGGVEAWKAAGLPMVESPT